MKKTVLVFAILCVIVNVASAAIVQGINIDFVTIGNAGNVADSTGHGAVAYEYRIGKYEVTAGQYCEFLNAVAAEDTRQLYNTNMWSLTRGCQIQRSGSYGSYTYSVASDYANRPVNYVSWYDTLRFANWLHNGQPIGGQTVLTTEDGAYDMSLGSSVVRKSDALVFLPTEDEWYKAAYYDGNYEIYYDYPTGTDMLPSNDLLNPDSGNNATFYNNDYTLGSPYYRTEVGDHENSDSPYGTFDMGGNVCEWNESIIFGSNRGIRGGAYGTGELDLRSLFRDADAASDEYSINGFRVASVPEPGTMLLLGLGGLLLRNKKHPTLGMNT